MRPMGWAVRISFAGVLRLRGVEPSALVPLRAFLTAMVSESESEGEVSLAEERRFCW